MARGYTEEGEIQKSPPVHVDESSPIWTNQGEELARRKVDCSVLPLLFLGLLVFQLDRMNLASALTGGFAAYIDVNQDTINLGNQLMFLGIAVLEIPFNMALQKIGPRKWISAQVITFGIVASLQVFVKNRAGFLTARAFLGLAEAGYIPGAVHTLSTWYKKRELAKRVAVLFFGMFGGNAISPILASVEGIFTVLVGISLLFLLPGSPSNPRPLLSRGFIRFTSTQKSILQQRLLLDSPGDQPGAQGLQIPLKIVWSTMTHYRRWPHFISTFCVFSTWSPLTTYTPSIIVSLGFSRTTANALSSIGPLLSLLVVYLLALLSDTTNRRGPTVILSHLLYLIVVMIARQSRPHLHNKWSHFGLWTAINAFAVGYHPIHNTWVQLNCADPRERSVSIAMWVMSAISGLMVGTRYFTGGDAPFYPKGLRTIIVMISVGMAFAMLQEGIYGRHNRKVRERAKKQEGGEEPSYYSL